MNVVDSSGWLEYFAGGPNAGFFATPLLAVSELLVPTLSILEVFKRVLGQRGENDALQAAALMQQGRILDLTVPLALLAARLCRTYKLPLADGVMLAAAQAHRAVLWTQDADFKGLPGVRYTPKMKP